MRNVDKNSETKLRSEGDNPELILAEAIKRLCALLHHHPHFISQVDKIRKRFGLSIRGHDAVGDSLQWLSEDKIRPNYTLRPNILKIGYRS
jgi:hypothetical protein